MDYSSNNVTFTLQSQAISTLQTPAGQSVSTAAELLISPNGKYLLASNRAFGAADIGSIAVFKINAPNAPTALTRVSITPSGGANPRSMSLDNTGSLLAVVNGNTNNTSIFTFNQNTGVLASTPVASMNSVVCSLFSLVSFWVETDALSRMFPKPWCGWKSTPFPPRRLLRCADFDMYLCIPSRRV